METNRISGRVAAMTLASVLTLAGCWGVWRLRVGAATPAPASRSASPVTTPDATLAAITTPLRASASDREIDKWAALAKKRPGETTSWVRLGDSFMQKARETADLSYYGKAEGCYAKALTISPNRTEALIGQAWVNSGRHEFEKSVELAQKALAVDPENNEAYGLIGDAYVEMGKYDLAVIQYQKMLDLRPDLSSYSRGAHMMQLTGDTKKALWLIDKAIKTGGPYAENTAWCRAQEAQIMLGVGAYMPADKLMTEALKSNPKNFHLLVTQGRAKSALKLYPSAIESFKKAVEIAPQLDAVIALGDLYKVAGKHDLAKNQYDLVESIHKLNKANGVKGDLQIAQFYADHDIHLPEALKMAEEECKTRSNVYAEDILAWCYFKNGRLPEAKKAIEAAVSVKTPEALFLYHKGMIQAKSGEVSSARKTLYEALSVSPNFHPIYARSAEEEIQKQGAISSENVSVKPVSLVKK